MKLGTTSFAFRFQLQDRTHAPSIPQLVEQTAAAGLQMLQICENARPLELPVEHWGDLARLGADLGVELLVGGKTTDAAVFAAYHERALALGSRLVRVVLENQQGVPASRDMAMRFFDEILPLLERSGTRVAVENYFGIACRDLSAWCEEYPPERVGYCVDSANSLRKFERLEEVLELLTPRAACWHVKDWKLHGTDTGFHVVGAVLGQGDLALKPLVQYIHAHDPVAQVFLENWPAATGDRERDMLTDAEMLRDGIAAWRQVNGTL